METKICSKCKEEKPVGDFYSDKSRKDGRKCYCKKCVTEYARKWYNANPEKARERFQKRYAANPEKVREQLRKWRAANPKEVREQSRKWRAANPKKVMAYTQKRILELPDCVVVSALIRSTNIPAKIIRQHPELIEVKRTIIKTKRLCKTSQN